MRGLTFPFEFMTCPVSQNHPILLANLLQRSRTAFSRVSFSSFFAFKEGMYDTQIAALLSSPTVSHRFLRQILLSQHNPFGMSCWVWDVDCCTRRGDNVSTQGHEPTLCL